MVLPAIHVDRSTGGEHNIFENTDWELQDMVRLEVQ